MIPEIFNKISKLTFYGFYDPSKGMVTVHFFNEEESKSDIIAYLNSDMSWDVREIISETSMLYGNCEIVTIKHNVLGIQKHGDTFDKFVRTGLKKMAEKVHGEDIDLAEKDKMFKILFSNSYEGI
jgi:hypothetical protein